MNFGIIGIGCIGSSLARDLRKHQLGTIYICDPDSTHLQQAEDLGLGDFYHQKIDDIVPYCDLIFICTPVSTIADILHHAAPLAKETTIFTDVGSTKTEIFAHLSDDLLNRVQFIGGHPITARTLGKGPHAGKENNFLGKKYILTPAPTVSEAALQTLIQVLSRIGAKTDLMSAEAHDHILAFTSHLSHILAFTSLQAGETLSKELNLDIFAYAGGSYQNLTQAADGNPKMWADILQANRPFCRQMIAKMIDHLQQFDALLDTAQGDQLQQHLEQTAILRTKQITRGRK